IWGATAGGAATGRASARGAAARGATARGAAARPGGAPTGGTGAVRARRAAAGGPGTAAAGGAGTAAAGGPGPAPVRPVVVPAGPTGPVRGGLGLLGVCGRLVRLVRSCALLCRLLSGFLLGLDLQGAGGCSALPFATLGLDPLLALLLQSNCGLAQLGELADHRVALAGGGVHSRLRGQRCGVGTLGCLLEGLRGLLGLGQGVLGTAVHDLGDPLGGVEALVGLVCVGADGLEHRGPVQGLLKV